MIWVDQAKVRMIEQVECFRAELELQPFVNRELPPYGKIHLPGTKTSHKISCGIPLRWPWAREFVPSRRWRETIRLDGPAPPPSLPRYNTTDPLNYAPPFS